jgi:hypothetical protein
LLSGGTALPIEHVVIHDVETLTTQRFGKLRGIIPITQDFTDALAEGCPFAAVHDNDIIAALDQPLDQSAADK